MKEVIWMSWMDKYKKLKNDFNKKDYHGEDPSEVNEDKDNDDCDKD